MNYNKYIVIHRQMRRSNYETFIIKVRVYTSYIFPINSYNDKCSIIICILGYKKIRFQGGFPAALGVTDQEAGYLYSMQGLVILVGTIALGWVGDRFSIRNIMLLSSLGVGCISLFITLFSPGLSMPVLLACFFSMLFFSEVLFKPANFKALRSSTSEDHQGLVFGLFEFGRGVLAFLISLLWAGMLYYQVAPKTMMLASCVIVLLTGLAVYFVVPKDVKVGDEDTHVESSMEAIKGIGYVAKLPVVWIAGLNVFCIYGTFCSIWHLFCKIFTSWLWNISCSCCCIC